MAGDRGGQEECRDAEHAVEADIDGLAHHPAAPIECAAQSCAFFILDAAKSRLVYDDETRPPSADNRLRCSTLRLSTATLLCGS
jgi:hypothetical protein